MRIALVAMSGIRAHNPELTALGMTLPGFVERGKAIASLPSLSLLTLAALTPERHEVSTDDEILNRRRSLSRADHRDPLQLLVVALGFDEAEPVAGSANPLAGRSIVAGTPDRGHAG